MEIMKIDLVEQLFVILKLPDPFVQPRSFSFIESFINLTDFFLWRRLSSLGTGICKPSCNWVRQSSDPGDLQYSILPIKLQIFRS